MTPTSQAGEKAVTLSWLPSVTPGVTGYRLYYGETSENYENQVEAGASTSVSVCCLTPGRTYFFAVTAYLANGEESEFSEEIGYRIKDPVNVPPSLDAINNLSIDEDAITQTVVLSGIHTGTAGAAEALSVTASSSAPSLISNPIVNYTSPGSTATLSFQPKPNASGSATITVTVDNGQTANSRFSQSFLVSVLPVNDRPSLDSIADVTIIQGSGEHSILLTGIEAGAINETESLTLSAVSSSPSLLPTPKIRYLSSDSSATLSFTPNPNSTGLANVTVTLDDGQSLNNRFSREFRIQIVPPATNTYLLEVESGVIAGPMEPGGSSAGTSAGSYVFSRVPEQGSIELSFSVAETGDYFLWARVIAADSGTDSFYISVDQESEFVFSMALRSWSHVWQWTELQSWSMVGNVLRGTPRPLRLTKGQHQLKFRCREAFSILDAVYLTTNAEFTEPELRPSPVKESNLLSPWNSSLLGTNSVGLSVVVKDGTFRMTSPGRLDGSTDNCLFVNQEFQQDGQITAVMELPGKLGEGGFAGIMIREDLGSSSVYAALGASSSGSLQWNFRQRASTPSASLNLSLDDSTTKWWLHLRRIEDTIIGYASLDGFVWFPMQSMQLSRKSSVQLGPVFASGDTPVEVIFTEVTLGAP